MAKTAPPVETPAVPGMTAADRAWVKEQIAAAIKELAAAARIRSPQ